MKWKFKKTAHLFFHSVVNKCWTFLKTSVTKVHKGGFFLQYRQWPLGKIVIKAEHFSSIDAKFYIHGLSTPQCTLIRAVVENYRFSSECLCSLRTIICVCICIQQRNFSCCKVNSKAITRNTFSQGTHTHKTFINTSACNFWPQTLTVHGRIIFTHFHLIDIQEDLTL